MDYRLNQLFRVKHGFAFKSEFFSDQGNYAVTSPGHFHEKGGFRDREGKEKFYVGDFPSDYVLKQGDLIIAMTEQGEGLLGSTAKIPKNNYYLHNQRLGLVYEVEHDLIDETFLYFLLNTEGVRKQIAASSSGTKVRHTSPGRIGKVKVELPPLPTQKKIASILSAYDDLIENNTQRIRLLEEMAEEMYKEWFVRMRFPGHAECRWLDKEGNEVERGTEGALPEGWESCSISDKFRTSSGGTPSRRNPEYYENGTINWVKTKELNGSFVFKSEEQITEAALANSSAKVFPANTILMGMYGGVHGEGMKSTLGTAGILVEPAATNQACCAFLPKNSHEFSLAYTFTFLKSQQLKFLNMSMGAAQQNISQEIVRNTAYIQPDSAITKKFDSICAPMFEGIKVLQKKNQVLQETRDLLLPRLISGKLSVEGLAEEGPRLAMAAEPEMVYGK